MNKKNSVLIEKWFECVPVIEVWDAWTKKEELDKWWTQEAEINFKIGGSFYHKWTDAKIGVKGRFLKIINQKEIVFTFMFENHFDNYPTIITLLFDEKPDGTIFKIEHKSFDSEKDIEIMKKFYEGWSGWLMELEKLLTKRHSSFNYFQTQ